MTDKSGIWRQWTVQEKAYIGNAHTKRFHLPGCPFGKRIGKNKRIQFKRLWEAFWEGYAPCKRCMPDGPLSH
jgi:micrococcal nuclease